MLYDRHARTRARARVYLSQHLDGSSMTLTFRGGRGRTRLRIKKLLSNFVARATSPRETAAFLSRSSFNVSFLSFVFQVSPHALGPDER